MAYRGHFLAVLCWLGCGCRRARVRGGAVAGPSEAVRLVSGDVTRNRLGGANGGSPSKGFGVAGDGGSNRITEKTRGKRVVLHGDPGGIADVETRRFDDGFRNDQAHVSLVGGFGGLLRESKQSDGECEEHGFHVLAFVV